MDEIMEDIKQIRLSYIAAGGIVFSFIFYPSYIMPFTMGVVLTIFWSKIKNKDKKLGDIFSNEDNKED